MKVYKCYELIKEIALGNIKEDTKVRCIKNNQIYTICYNDILIPQEGQDFIENDFGASLWLNFEFEIIEDEEIDIDSIKTIEVTKVIYNLEDASDLIYKNEDKINELIKAVKHLNKEIQSIKK